MKVLGITRYRVFGSATFRGNPVTLFEVDALDDSASLLRAAQGSRTEDNVFFMAAEREPVMARFFSSNAELWLCGHGLLALSHHLRVPDVIGVREVQSPSGSWQIYADAQGAWVLMPAQQAIKIDDSAHWMNETLRSIGIRYDSLYLCPNDVWIVVLHELEELLSINADAVEALACGNHVPGALIAALRLQDAAYGFRYFAPWHGKQEDSGTGSAHCYLAPLLAASPATATALQFSPEGVAEMRLSLRGDGVAVSGRIKLL
jgi:predicted PhzF superfamily epimerase YddE/YHI9